MQTKTNRPTNKRTNHMVGKKPRKTRNRREEKQPIQEMWVKGTMEDMRKEGMGYRWLLPCMELISFLIKGIRMGEISKLCWLIGLSMHAIWADSLYFLYLLLKAISVFWFLFLPCSWLVSFRLHLVLNNLFLSLLLSCVLLWVSLVCYYNFLQYLALSKPYLGYLYLSRLCCNINPSGCGRGIIIVPP